MVRTDTSVNSGRSLTRITMIVRYRGDAQGFTVDSVFRGGLRMPGMKTKRRMAVSTAHAMPAPVDAVSVLEADHRQVETWFAQYHKARGDDRKLELATSICTALKI